MDFEGTDELDTEEGMVKVDYLIGLLVKDKQNVKFHPFVAENLADEKKMFDEFVEFAKLAKFLHLTEADFVVV